MAAGLSIRKLADKSAGHRVAGYHPTTGEKTLVNPETGAAEAWPLAGVAIEGKVPKTCNLSTAFVARGRDEGWLVLENSRAVHRPGGPEENPWRVTHTFEHADAVVFKTVDGDVRYEVVEQPDKYPERKDGELGFGGEVRWFYKLRLEG